MQGLFDEQVSGALSKMGKKILFLGDVGAGARMKLVVNMIMGSMMVGEDVNMILVFIGR
jgi:3-hydroxyisobutyrate dehydrogenase-like beta-hydroxyacid dehydrogenase